MKPDLNSLFPRFEKLYWIEFPLFIRDMLFDEENRKVDIFVDYHRKATFPCSCGRESLKIHDRVLREWRALDIGSYQTIIHLAVPRTKCPDCGVKTVKVGWARDHSHFTYLMEERVALLSHYMPLSNVARFLNVSERRVRSVIERLRESGPPPPAEKAARPPLPLGASEDASPPELSPAPASPVPLKARPLREGSREIPAAPKKTGGRPGPSPADKAAAEAAPEKAAADESDPRGEGGGE
jgi:hypothetical protein